MYVFDEDETVHPKESGWFSEVDTETGRETKLRERRIFRDDWLGLKHLDEKGGLHFESTPGRHMAISKAVLVKVFEKYFS